MIKIPEYAFKPMSEPLVWRQDKAPHASGTLGGVVTHASPDAMAAGHPLGQITADPWIVRVPLAAALVASIRPGDTLSRLGIGAEKLTVQEVSRTDGAWLLICSRRERPTE